MPEPNRSKSAPGSDKDSQADQAGSVTVADAECPDRVRAAEEQRDEYLSLLQRTQADFENYQKRLQRERADERRYAHAGFAREILPILDNLQRALEAARSEGESGPLVEGVALVQSQLLLVLRRFGIEPIVVNVGEPFDPHRHDAVLEQPRVDMPPGTVVAVVEPGYSLYERILRPAKVIVARPADT